MDGMRGEAVADEDRHRQSDHGIIKKGDYKLVEFSREGNRLPEKNGQEGFHKCRRFNRWCLVVFWVDAPASFGHDGPNDAYRYRQNGQLGPVEQRCNRQAY
jgi:hypothetical protein